jgi:GT2 family glycosyltransferase
MITVILTKYKRPHLLENQFISLRNQTLKPDEILVCDNSLQNLGVWARFSMALNAKSDFVCVIDDDTIPGIKWL